MGWPIKLKHNQTYTWHHEIVEVSEQNQKIIVISTVAVSVSMYLRWHSSIIAQPTTFMWICWTQGYHWSYSWFICFKQLSRLFFKAVVILQQFLLKQCVSQLCDCQSLCMSLGHTPKVADVFRLYCSLEAGLTVRDLCMRSDPRTMGIDER